MIYSNEITAAPHPQHRVRFAEASEMILVTNLARTPAKSDIWFHQDELDSFKANNSRHAHLVRSLVSRGVSPSASNILGVEKFLTEQLTGEYKAGRRRMYEQVLAEVVWQRYEGEDDPDRLARVSAQSTKWARERARAAALLLDQDQEADRLLDEAKAEETARKARKSRRRRSWDRERTNSPRGVCDFEMISAEKAMRDSSIDETKRTGLS